MQFATLSIGLFAALAVAEHHHGIQHFHHRRHLNATTSDVSTTLTVFQTVVRTITSCAPTITDCPARSAANGGVVTEIVALTTTVCPVTAAESIASSIISAAGGNNGVASTSAAVNMPLSTNIAGNVVSSEAPAPGSLVASDTVLTYTLGTGASTTVVTTTIKHTSTATAYVTEYVTKPRSSATPAPVASGAAGSQAGGEAAVTKAAPKVEPTTTVTSSSTITKYVTVRPAPSSFITPVDKGNGGGNEGGVGGECVPVTVTVALSTVTVTYTPMGASPTAAPSVQVVAPAVVKAPVAASSPGMPGNHPPAAASSPAMPNSHAPASTAEGIQTPAPISSIPCSTAPYGNGTAPLIKPTYSQGGTGFLTIAKPTTTMAGYD